MRNLDRAAESRAKLVPLQNGTGSVRKVIEKGVGIEIVVANVVVCAPMHFIRSRLGHHTDDAARVPAVFRVVIACQDAKFFDRIGVGIHHYIISHQVGVQPAIQKVRDRGRPVAGNTEAMSPCIVVGRSDPGLQQRQTKHIAAIEWKVFDRFAGHRFTDCGIHGLDTGNHGIDGNRLLLGAENQRNVVAIGLVDEEPLLLGHRHAKAGMVHGNLVDTDGNGLHVKIALAVGHGGNDNGGGHVDHLDICARNNGALRVRNRADNAAGRILPPRR